MKRFVLIGCGNWGGWWVRDFIPETADVARCAAVVDVNREEAERAGNALHVPVYTNIGTALRENPVDYAVVTASIPHHLEVFRDILLTRPCPILSEKPVAGNWEDCLEIQQLVKEVGIKCAFTFSHRFEQDKQTFARLLQSGKYGKINTIVGRLIVHKQQPIRPPEMTLIDGGVHYLDMLRPFTGSEAKTVYARAWDCPWPESGGHAASAFVQAEMQNGIHATMEYLLGSAENRNSWCDEYFRAECERASVVLDQRQITARWTDESGNLITEDVPLLPGAHWKHDKIIRDFNHWLDGGPEPALCLRGSMKAMALLYAAVESTQTGQAVSVTNRLEQCGGNE